MSCATAVGDRDGYRREGGAKGHGAGGTAGAGGGSRQAASQTLSGQQHTGAARVPQDPSRLPGAHRARAPRAARHQRRRLTAARSTRVHPAAALRRPVYPRSDRDVLGRVGHCARKAAAALQSARRRQFHTATALQNARTHLHGLPPLEVLILGKAHVKLECHRTRELCRPPPAPPAEGAVSAALPKRESPMHLSGPPCSPRARAKIVQYSPHARTPPPLRPDARRDETP